MAQGEGLLFVLRVEEWMFVISLVVGVVCRGCE
jgi:hypothetical protein